MEEYIFSIIIFLTLAVSEAVRKSDCQDLSLFMLTITTVSIVFGVAVIFISVMYCWTREKENIKKAKLLKSAEHDLNLRKNTSCTPPEISLTALTSLLHGNLIHQGYRSAIRLGTFNSHTVAIKVHPPSSHAECRNENKIYAQLGEHTNIAKYEAGGMLHFGHCSEGIVVMKYYTQGSLWNYLSQHKLTCKEMLVLSFSLVNGLTFLHGNSYRTNGHRTSIAHRNISSRNILVKQNGTCALADFSYAVKLEEKRPTHFMVGELRYLAPEVLLTKQQPSNWHAALKQVDVYALSLVLWEICRRCSHFYEEDAVVPAASLPYSDELGDRPSLQKLHQHVCVKNMRPFIPARTTAKDIVTSLYRETIQECWDEEADSRLTAHCVLERIKQMYQESCPKGVSLQKTNETVRLESTTVLLEKYLDQTEEERKDEQYFLETFPTQDAT